MNVEYFYPINISNETDFRAITITTTLTFFAFLGLESATVPDNKVQNAKENVSKSTIYGVIFTFFVYLLSSIALFGLLSPEQIQHSNAPYADAGGIILGDYAKYIVAIFAIISALGCLNGWTLLQIELTKNLSKNNLFPKIFLKENANSIPSSGLIISNTIVNPQFKDFKNGKLKIISFYAKKARGLMTRFLIDNEINSLSDIESFNSSGYMFSQNETRNPLEPVFVR